MMTYELKFIIAGILSLISVGSGISPGLYDRPLSRIVFNIHKICSVVLVIFLGVILYGIFKNISFSGINRILFFLSFSGILLLFITGAFLTLIPSPPVLYKIFHITGTVLTLTTGIFLGISILNQI